MAVKAVYFDGEVAADREVKVELGPDGLLISGADVGPQSWAYGTLSAINRHHAGHPFRLSHAGQPGTRLVFRDEAFIAGLIARAPHLSGGFNPHLARKIAAWTVAGLAGVAIVGYLILQYAPERVAFLLPDSWRDRAGAQIEASLTEGTKHCRDVGGEAALRAMALRLADGDPAIPPAAIRVYDIPIVNAFAMPGGRIVLTKALIQAAEAPEEVAGVLAHEVGHVVNRHSEAQLVRATGLQILINVATGGSAGQLSNFAGLAAILSYSRAAEREADAYSLWVMRAAAIDPLGFKHFFERLQKDRPETSTGFFKKIGNVLATHPGTEDRIARIEPLPDGVTARPVLTEAQWQALRGICG